MDVSRILADNLRIYRAKSNLTRTRLSELSGVHVSTIVSLESKQATVRISDVEHIADALNIPPFYLFKQHTE